MNISILEILKSNLAINLEDGIFLYDALNALKCNELTISFVGIERLSTLFLNESLGRFILEDKTRAESISFIFPDNKPLFSKKVNDIVENVLMGDAYDSLVNAAKISL